MGNSGAHACNAVPLLHGSADGSLGSPPDRGVRRHEKRARAFCCHEGGRRPPSSRPGRGVCQGHSDPCLGRISFPGAIMIRIGDRQQFAVARNFLKSAYSDDSNVLADRVGDFDPAKHSEEPPLIRMFFLGRAIELSEWESVASPEVRTVFSDLGFTEAASNNRIRCSVLLYRTHGMYIASDRFMTDEGQVGRPAEDCVYYALTDTAHHYLYSLPSRPYGQVLDIGTGSGVAALILSPNAKQVYATDIAPRCILFTEFNRQLNGFENIITREGSLYEPVEGLKFD